MDRSLKIYDVRTYKCLQSYKLGAAAGFLDFSQMGLLGVGLGNVVEVSRVLHLNNCLVTCFTNLFIYMYVVDI